jgi:two-component system cell cycle sensor histidine kinase/response regulator CckA
MDDRPRILLVDGDEGTRKTLTLILRKNGYETETAATGQEALEKARERTFNLAFLDIRLSDMEGVDLIALLKQMHPCVAVIMIAGHASVGTAVQALNEGASGYVTKPVNIDELLAKAREALQKQQLAEEKRRAEEALRQSADRFRQFFDNIPECGYLISPEGAILDVNNAARRALGYRKEELVGKPLKTIYAPESLPKMEQLFARWQETGQLMDEEMVILTRAGERRTVLLSAGAVRDREGQILHSVSVQKDITERKRAEEALRESEKRFRKIVETVPSLLVITDGKGNNLYVSPNCEEITGYTQEELQGQVVWWVHEDDTPRAKEVFERTYREGIAGKDLEYKAVKKNGELWYASSSWEPLGDAEGKLRGVVFQTTDITERKRAEEELRRLKEFNEGIVQGVDEGLLIEDEQGIITFINPALEKLLGYASEELVGCHWRQIVPEGEIELVQAKVAQRLVGISDQYETQLLSRDGRQIAVLVSARPLFENDSFTGVLSAFSDITQRKRLQAEIGERRLYLERVLASAPDAIVTLDKQHKIREWNQGAEKLFGYSVEEAVGHDLDELISGSNPKTFREAISLTQQVLAGEPVPPTEVTRYRKDGTPVDAILAGSPVLHGGELIGVVATYTDITGRKHAEEALRRSEARYRAVVEDQTELISRLLPDGTLTFVNDAYCRFLGKRWEELIGRSFLPPIAEEDRPNVEAALASLSREAPVVTVEDRVIAANGEERLLRWTNRAIFDEQGDLVEIQSVGRDITERQRAEEALRESEEKYRNLVENINDVLFSTDENGVITYISPPITPISGYSPSEITGRPFRELLPQEDLPRVMQQFQKVMSGHIEPSEYRIVTKSGEIRWVRSSSRPILVGNRPVGLQGMLTDITERKRLERQLLQAQKMEAVGRLTGGIAHDFNNLLTSIRGHATFVLADTAEDDPRRQDLQRVITATGRAAGLIRQLTLFSHGGFPQLQPLRLNDILQETHELLQGTFPRSIEIELLLETEVWTIEADPAQMSQVLMNLCINASDAMPDGGMLTLETRNVTLSEEYARTRIEARPGSYVRLSVSDTGVGMSEEVQAHIFEPFFTTKKVGEGLGLGLATVYGIVKEHDGFITVYSEVGKGSTFHICLPATEQSGELVEKKEAELPQGTEAVLLVDDEDAVL